MCLTQAQQRNWRLKTRRIWLYKRQKHRLLIQNEHFLNINRCLRHFAVQNQRLCKNLIRNTPTVDVSAPAVSDNNPGYRWVWPTTWVLMTDVIAVSQHKTPPRQDLCREEPHPWMNHTPEDTTRCKGEKTTDWRGVLPWPRALEDNIFSCGKPQIANCVLRYQRKDEQYSTMRHTHTHTHTSLHWWLVLVSSQRALRFLGNVIKPHQRLSPLPEWTCGLQQASFHFPM